MRKIFAPQGEAREYGGESGDCATGFIKKTPPVNEPEEWPAAWCSYCLGEIYSGEEYYRVDGEAVCTDCLDRLAKDHFGFCRVTGGI